MCSGESFALIATWPSLLTRDNADYPADMTDATWQSEQMNSATISGPATRSAPTL
jgi:hypothetical protein